MTDELAKVLVEGVHKYMVQKPGPHFKLGCEAEEYEFLYRGRPAPKELGGMVDSMVSCNHDCEFCLEPCSRWPQVNDHGHSSIVDISLRVNQQSSPVLIGTLQILKNGVLE